MRSSMSLNSKKIKIQFSCPLYTPITDLYYAENPIQIEQWFQRYSHFSYSQKNQNTKESELALSNNQY